MLITPHIIRTTPLSYIAIVYITYEAVLLEVMAGHVRSPDDHKSPLPEHLMETHRSRAPVKSARSADRSGFLPVAVTQAHMFPSSGDRCCSLCYSWIYTSSVISRAAASTLFILAAGTQTKQRVFLWERTRMGSRRAHELRAQDPDQEEVCSRSRGESRRRISFSLSLSLSTSVCILPPSDFCWSPEAQREDGGMSETEREMGGEE